MGKIDNMTATYKIRRITRTRKTGITTPAFCTLEATLKFDGEEAPHCVYNEYVALRLAQTLHAPVAEGVLTSTGDGPAYASLMLDSPGINLPDVLETQFDQVAKRYPQPVALLVAYDLFIGNRDRARNLKAALATPHIQLFAAFDHSHALLGVDQQPERSISQLQQGDLLVRSHPFYGRVQGALLQRQTARIAALSEDIIRECCQMGKAFRGVSESLQTALAEALIQRRRYLEGIVQFHDSVIRAQP
ncbi:MAG: hypothetical protein AB7U63_06345 [Porticoccaceae bacterium]